MSFILPFSAPLLPAPLRYPEKILLCGSCFTEHISVRLAQHKFSVLSNPHGILFNPLSVSNSIRSYAKHRIYTEEDLFPLNELWNSWDHHTCFSDLSRDTALARINASQKQASEFMLQASKVIITLGSAFQYYLKEGNRPVANNHRAPAQWFEKRLLPVAEIVAALEDAIKEVRSINPRAFFLFTISPVRHIRDGVTENNRSKARLIEAVHDIVARFSDVYYFPAYELVIDVLRDYRFYDVDMVHPNYQATSFVWEQFVACCIDSESRALMKEVREISVARAHKPRFPQTEAHRQFLERYREKVAVLLQTHPYLDWGEELTYFSSQ